MKSINYSRVLHSDDYELFTGHEKVTELLPRLQGKCRYEHEHRKWEYGLAHDFLMSQGISKVLEIGGGGSLLSPLLAESGMSVVQSDLEDEEPAVLAQNELLGLDTEFILADFSDVNLNLGKYEAVVSISTIEHVYDAYSFFENMLKHAEKAIFLTTDFSEHASIFSEYHLRTYNKHAFKWLLRMAADYGFFPPEIPEWEYRGAFVYDYSFASLALVKKG